MASSSLPELRQPASPAPLPASLGPVGSSMVTHTHCLSGAFLSPAAFLRSFPDGPVALPSNPPGTQACPKYWFFFKLFVLEDLVYTMEPQVVIINNGPHTDVSFSHCCRPDLTDPLWEVVGAQARFPQRELFLSLQKWWQQKRIPQCS